MKTKNKVLIGLLALCLAGSIGSALALTRTGATGNATTGSFDSAVYLYWGHNASSASLSNITSLTANTPVYRYLSVSPQSTKTVAGTVTVTFTLAQSEGCHLNGLTVCVYDTEGTLLNDSTVETGLQGKTALFSLTKNALTNSATITITATGAEGAAHETVNNYAIKVLWDGSNDGVKALGGSMNITQSFAAANA